MFDPNRGGVPSLRQRAQWWLHDTAVDAGNSALYLVHTYWLGFWMWLADKAQAEIEEQ